eukprot:gene17421-biopygen5337
MCVWLGQASKINAPPALQPPRGLFCPQHREAAGYATVGPLPGMLQMKVFAIRCANPPDPRRHTRCAGTSGGDFWLEHWL